MSLETQASIHQHSQSAKSEVFQIDAKTPAKSYLEQSASSNVGLSPRASQFLRSGEALQATMHAKCPMPIDLLPFLSVVAQELLFSYTLCRNASGPRALPFPVLDSCYFSLWELRWCPVGKPR